MICTELVFANWFKVVCGQTSEQHTRTPVRQRREQHNQAVSGRKPPKTSWSQPTTDQTAT